MNRVVVSVPRVLDSAMVVTQDAQLQIPAGTLPRTVTTPCTVNRIQAAATETQMTNIVITPLGDHTRCARVTATVQVPLTLAMTDSNRVSFESHTSLTKNISVVLYIPEDTAFPYDITAEAAFGCDSATVTDENASIVCATTKILVRITATTDLLIPSYGYAPMHRADNACSNSQNFLNQPLFPQGKVY